MVGEMLTGREGACVAVVLNDSWKKWEKARETVRVFVENNIGGAAERDPTSIDFAPPPRRQGVI